MTVYPKLLLLAVAAAAFVAPAAAHDVVPHGPRAGLMTDRSLPPPLAHPGERCRRPVFDCGVSIFDQWGAEAAIPWFRRAAAEGSVPAMRALGQIYLDGEGGAPRNSEEALAWFFQAAQRGDGASMYVLARAFEKGIGVEPDPQLARQWLELSARDGYRRARRALSAQR